MFKRIHPENFEKIGLIEVPEITWLSVSGVMSSISLAIRFALTSLFDI